MDKITQIAEEILEQLEIQDVFAVNIGGMTINIAESVVVSWIVIGIVLILCLILTTGLRVNNISRRQALAEWLVEKGEGLVGGMVGEEGHEYIPYLLHRSAGIQATDQGSECYSSAGDNEYHPGAGCIDQKEESGRLAEELHTACCTGHSDQHTGAWYQATFTVYATFRKCSRSIRNHGTAEVSGTAWSARSVLALL